MKEINNELNWLLNKELSNDFMLKTNNELCRFLENELAHNSNIELSIIELNRALQNNLKLNSIVNELDEELSAKLLKDLLKEIESFLKEL